MAEVALPDVKTVKGADRVLDLFVVAFFVPLVIAGGMVFLILAGGDWDFWVDWKDRQWWPVLAAGVNIIVPAALQYIFWRYLRLPAGATITALVTTMAAWLDRALNFHFWVWFPVSFVWPAVFLFQAVLLDLVLLFSRSLLVTWALGAFLWGFMFYHVNYFMLAPFLQPVDYHGQLLTVADVMGLEYPRTATPFYSRIIEKGALRAFLGETIMVVSFFTGFISLGGYAIGYGIGKFVTSFTARFMERLA